MEKNDLQMSKLDELMPIRVHLGMGCQGTVMTKTCASIMGVLITSHDKITGYSMRQGGDITSARTFCVQDAIEKKATHIFFVDSDMSFPPDTLDRLLAHDKEIVTVEYNRRKLPLEKITAPLEEASETELYKARVMGGGCLLIKLSIFEKLGKPWFNFGRGKDGMPVMGEDTWFLNTARDAGIDSWIDPNIKVGHIGEYLY
jgi:hypothetical protein